jgi:hypothetical protein
VQPTNAAISPAINTFAVFTSGALRTVDVHRFFRDIGSDIDLTYINMNYKKMKQK